MEKQKRWQFITILIVLALTLYNILPTIIYYSKPLKSPISQEQAKGIASSISTRVNELEPESIDWVHSFCKLLQVSPKKVEIQPQEPGLISVEFPDEKQAKLFRKFLPQAGSLIPFIPAQLGLAQNETQGNTVTVMRRIGFRFDPKDSETLFQFSPKASSDGKIEDFYFQLISDRFTELATQVFGTSNQSKVISAIVSSSENSTQELLSFAKEITTLEELFGAKSPIFVRYLQSFAQTEIPDHSSLVTRFVKKIDDQIASIDTSLKALGQNAGDENVRSLERQKTVLSRAKSIINANSAVFGKEQKPLLKKDVRAYLQRQRASNSAVQAIYTLGLPKNNVFFKNIVLDWSNDQVILNLQDDVKAIVQLDPKNERQRLCQEEINKLIFNDVARISALTDEKVNQGYSNFYVSLSKMPGSSSILALDLSRVAKQIANDTLATISEQWTPTQQDLVLDKFPRFDASSYQKADASQKRLCLVVVSPESQKQQFQDLRAGSLYVILKNFQSLIQQYKEYPESREAIDFDKDFESLAKLLQRRGFIGYSGAALGTQSELSKDFIFELQDYYSVLLKASREDFSVLGTKSFAALELSTLEQRIITENRIEDAIQEDLLRAQELYQQAQVSLEPQSKFTVPKPYQNPYWANFKRSFSQYFRGDDSKVLKWGLDLSGGKSVRIDLVNAAGQKIESQDDLRQAVNELYTRINKMGVSERTIRIENDTILIDFPGAQGISAEELIKASTMYFHVANEQYGRYNPALSQDVHQFLQDVWNEAVVTNRKDIDSINQIAYEKIQQASKRSSNDLVKDSATVLYENGLRLENPNDKTASVAFDDSVSKIAMFHGDDQSEWGRQAHPLIVVFRNFALEGANLENVQTSYDASKGNVLLFSVKRSYTREDERGSASPQDDFYTWTSHFCEEKIAGTPLEKFAPKSGYRMAVIFNGQVICAPTLNVALSDHAMISGSFTQREVAKLATDLKAGSLSFAPRILSEHNVSPELGKQERDKGIIAATIAIIAVVGAMIGYYRFAGVVASVAVLFNIFLIWAVMQNIDAALTLPGIAGIVLTIGMAVDANVLVFERIREEFRITGKIASAIHLGYKRAFSAIVDSNITTILAAIILMQFDCGPIKGFAVTLVIGILSSMFTSLFLTRYFFAGWVQNPAHKELKMAEWIGKTNFDFLKKTKLAIFCSIIVFAVGALAFVAQWKSMFGMDFTGGYSLIVELDITKDKDSSALASKALKDAGLQTKEFHIRELGRNDLLRIQLSTALENQSRPFANLEQVPSTEQVTYEYQTNPRIVWLINQLQKGGLTIKPSSLTTLETNWTVMSGQFSDAMRNNAIMALSLSLLAVLIYIAIRFEWKFAVSSVLALIHDVFLTVAVAALAHLAGLGVEINLETIGAIMMIIGYSLNDTIIIFDRIREDIRVMRKKSFSEIINHALNATLSRTIMTSGTTLLVLGSLVVFGGSSIFAFSFVMFVGILLGTFSSLFIACPILLYLEGKDNRGHELVPAL